MSSPFLYVFLNRCLEHLWINICKNHKWYLFICRVSLLRKRNRIWSGFQRNQCQSQENSKKSYVTFRRHLI